MRSPQLLFLLLAGLLTGCAADPDADIREISLDLDFRRTDSLLWAASSALISDTSLSYETVYDRFLAEESDFFFLWAAYNPLTMHPERIPDSVLRALTIRELIPVLDDSAMHHLLDTLRQVFPYGPLLSDRLSKPLKRLRKHFPDANIPAFRTHVNGYAIDADTRNVDQVLSLPGYVSLGLHYFIGEKAPYFAPTLPQYVRRRFSPEMLEVMVVREISDEFVFPVEESRQPTLLDKIIQAGIKAYFIQQLLPHTPDSSRLLYTARQMEWADFYEQRIYKELQPLLYTTDFQQHQQFLGDKPFTSALAQESAPRLGEYCGWKIVSSFMKKNPALSLPELMDRTDYQVIFQQAKYKP